MEIKTKIGVIEKTLYFDRNSSKPISPAYESRDNWGFNYTTLYENGQPIDDKSRYAVDTIFLDSELDELYGISELQNVHINTKGPKIIEDRCTRDSILLPFKMEFIFESETPIDVRQLDILLNPTLPVGTRDGDDVLYSVSRKFNTVVMKPCIANLKMIKNDKFYTLTFDLLVNGKGDTSPDLTIDQLNAEGKAVTIRVYDINGNGIQYVADGPWRYIDVDIFSLQHLVISFEDITPPNKVVTPNKIGSCTCVVYNPNKELWILKPTIKMHPDSIGRIQGGSFDYSRYETEGIVTFKIVNINKNGNVIIDAWLTIDNIAQKQIMYDKTWAEGICGPWIMIDPEGRKIKMLPYVPKYLNDEHFKEFVEFTEFFLNSMYESLSNSKNIGILEKVARIGDFNFVERLEKPLIKHFKEEFAIEIDPNFDDMKNFLMQKRISTKNEEGEIVSSNFLYEDITDDDLYDFMRYIYREIPEYNQYKGSYKGMKMALNILGLCVKIVELWSKTNDADTDDLMRSDELNDYPLRFDKSDGAIIAKYYLTSRFDVDMEETDITFKEFNDLADNIIRLIFQVKPVTRLLRKLSYIYYMWIDIHFSYWIYSEALEYEKDKSYHRYSFTWDLSNEDTFKKHQYVLTPNVLDGNNVNDCMYNISKLYIPFKAVAGSVKFYAKDNHTTTYTKPVPNWTWNSDHKTAHTQYKNTVSKDSLIEKKKFTKNSYLVLFNIAHKLKVSKQNKLKIKIKYDYTKTAWENSTVSVPKGGYINVPIEKYTNNPIVLERDLDLWDFTNGNPPPGRNAIWIEAAENGFYINFQGSFNSALGSLQLNEELIKTGRKSFGRATDPLNYKLYKLNEFSITIENIVCALGTDWLVQMT